MLRIRPDRVPFGSEVRMDTAPTSSSVFVPFWRLGLRSLVRGEAPLMEGLANLDWQYWQKDSKKNWQSNSSPKFLKPETKKFLCFDMTHDRPFLLACLGYHGYFSHLFTHLDVAFLCVIFAAPPAVVPFARSRVTSLEILPSTG